MEAWRARQDDYARGRRLEVFWPTCWRCRKPVESITDYGVSPMTGDWRFQVFCHGAVETTVIPARMLRDGPIEIRGSYAFRGDHDVPAVLSPPASG